MSESTQSKTLVQRLRIKAGKGGIIPIGDMTILESADEIERLRGKLQEIVDKYHPDGNPMYLHDIAFEALQGETP